MKKFLISLACFVGFGVIVVLCYFFGYPREKILMKEGNYYLCEIRSGTDKENMTQQLVENDDYYIVVSSGNKMMSYSAEIGFKQDGKKYVGRIAGTGLKVEYMGETVYEGVYADELIVIGVQVESEVDGQTVITYYEYSYMMK